MRARKLFPWRWATSGDNRSDTRPAARLGVTRLEDRVTPAFDLTIGATGPTVGVDRAGGTFTAAAAGAFLNVADLRAALTAGDAVVTTGTGGSQPGHVRWLASAALDVNGTGTGRGLTLVAGDPDAGGRLTFDGRVFDSAPGGDAPRVEFRADRMSFGPASAVGVGPGSVTLAPRTSGVSVAVNPDAPNPADLNLTSADLARVTAGTLRLGGAAAAHAPGTPLTAWNVTVDGPLDAAGRWGTLALYGRGLVRTTGDGAVAVPALAAAGWEGVHLVAAGNAVGTVAGRTYDFNFSVTSGTLLTVGAADGLTGVTTLDARVTGSAGDVYLSAPAGLTVAAAIEAGAAGAGGSVFAGPNVSAPGLDPTQTGNVLLNAGAVPAVGTDRPTFPLAYTTHTIALDPINNFVDRTVLSVDRVRNRTRAQVQFDNPNDNPVTVDILIRYDEFTSYRTTQTSGVLSTVAAPVGFTGPPELAALPRTAERLDDISIGLATVEQVRFRTASKIETHQYRRVGRHVLPEAVFSRGVSTPNLLSTYLQYQNLRSFGGPLPAGVFAVPDHTRAGVRVVNPQSGEPVQVGLPATARFVADAAGGAFTGYDVLLSTDGGATFPVTVAANQSFAEPGGGFVTFNWTPTAEQASPTARLRVVARLAGGGTVTGDSLLSFAVDPEGPPPPAVLPQPRAFTTRSFVIDPVNNFFDETDIAFDMDRQVQTVGITFNNPNETPLSITIVLQPDAGFVYRIAPLPDGGVSVFSGTYNLPLNNQTLTGAAGGLVFRAGQRMETVLVDTELTRDTYTYVRDGAIVRLVGIESRANTSPNSLAAYLAYTDYAPSPGLTSPLFEQPPAALAPEEAGTARPVVSSIGPLAGTPVWAGRPTTVRFQVLSQPFLPAVTAVEVQLSLDGGATFPESLGTVPASGSTEFTLPWTPTVAQATDQARLRYLIRRADGTTVVQPGQDGFRVRAEAPGFVVTTADDVIDPTDGVRSLREAVLAANAHPDANTITFDPAAFPAGAVVRLNGSPLTVSTSLTVRGAVTVNADNRSRVFEVSGAGAEVTLDGLTLTGGAGGAVELRQARLTVRNATLRANFTAGDGGAVRNVDGELVLDGVHVADNVAAGSGGGVASFGRLEAAGSTFAGNTAQAGGGGGLANGGTAFVVNGTFVGNAAAVGGGVSSVGTLRLLQSTLAGNAAGLGGGLAAGAGAAFVGNVLAVGNAGGEVTGGVTDLGGNLLALPAGFTLDRVLVTTAGRPRLTAVSGRPPTVALVPGTPALNAGLAANAVDAGGRPLTADQRGLPRTVGPAVDAGAVEEQLLAPRVLSFRLLYGTGRSHELLGTAARIAPWLVTGVRVVFDAPVTATAASLGGLAARAVAGSGTDTLTWELAAPVGAANVSAVLQAVRENAVRSLWGVPLAGAGGPGTAFSQLVRVLAGDFDGDGVVTLTDTVRVRNLIGTADNPFADVTGDGAVTQADVDFVRARVGTRLPAAAPTRPRPAGR